MKFNQNTVSVLKNFSAINPSISMKMGNVLKTISPQKSVMAIATLDQDFEGNAAIYDLSRFLSTVSLFDDPEIVFLDNKFTIKGGRSRVNYAFASESMILTPPDKEINLPTTDVNVDIQWSDFDRVMKAAAVLKLPDIAFIGDSEGIKLAAINATNAVDDTFDVVLDTSPQQREFRMIFRSENLKMIPGDYNVQISSKGISKFSNDVVTYYIAVESTSSMQGE